VAEPPTLGRLVIVIGPRPSDRLDEGGALGITNVAKSNSEHYRGRDWQQEHDTSSIAALPPTLRLGRLVVVAGPRPSDRRDDGINVYRFVDSMQVSCSAPAPRASFIIPPIRQPLSHSVLLRCAVVCAGVVFA
jgi:hypothetical protein